MPGDDLTLLRDAAALAGEIAMRYFKRGAKTWDKGDGQGPVTQADIEIDTTLRALLLDARPDYGWLSEETPDNSDRLERDHVFILDPIDGTRAFIEGHEIFAVSLAVQGPGGIQSGVVHLPARGQTYWATCGSGAFLNGDRLQPARQKDPAQATVLAARPQMDPANWPGGVPAATRHFRSSLAYRLCAVAEGAFDSMVTLRDCWEWDIAAGSLICSEAGATITDRVGQPLRFNNVRPKTPGVVAGSHAVHTDFLARLQA